MDTPPDDVQTLIREVRQRLQSLRRAGVDRIAAPKPSAPVPRSAKPMAVSVPVSNTTAAPSQTLVPKPPPEPRRALGASATVASLFGEAKIADVVIPPEQRADALDRLRAEVASCTRCPALVANRTQTVFGVGNPNARLMFIGEAPGADEDRQGEPFVGRAGQLLNDMITKGMKLKREDVYIANIVKCRPPENRNPLPEEAANCLPYLERQIAIVRPQFLCLLGKVPASVLLATAMPMGRLRGKWHRYRGIPTIATWHPAYLLRKPEAKKDTWQDLQMLMNAMGIPLPGRTKPE
jgi:DNA polymerase